MQLQKKKMILMEAGINPIKRIGGWGWGYISP
jgi:hypothetical protein